MRITEFKKIKHDVNGNPRFVTSWLGYGFKTYAQAVEAAKKIGGRKYRHKSFAGGLVFQAYECELEIVNKRLAELAAPEEATL